MDNAYVSFVTRRRAAAPRQGPEKGPGPKLWTLKKNEDNIRIYSASAQHFKYARTSRWPPPPTRLQLRFLYQPGCPLWHLIILRAYCRPCVPFLQTSSFTRDPFTVHGIVGSDASRTRVSNAAFVGTDGAIDEDAAAATAGSDDGCKQRLRLRAATGAAEGIRATT